MIIDVHGHFTTTPAAHEAARDVALAGPPSGSGVALGRTPISDDELRECLEPNQLRVLSERGEDLMLFSPKASAMRHDMSDPRAASDWARACNDLVHRAASLYPSRLAPVAQLPQTPAGNIDACVDELRRVVEELGFVGCNLNPDPSGTWAGKPLTNESWFPLYEALEELDVPAMVHVSSACNPNFHTLGAHYLNADTTAYMQLTDGELFRRFPGLRLVIPHGGGAVPYHWGRYRGLAERAGLPDPAHLFSNVWFDTCVYHQPGVDLLLEVVPSSNVLFASEMLGAVRGADPETGIEWDDTLVYVRQAGLPAADLEDVLGGNALRVYPRLAAWLAAHGDSRSTQEPTLQVRP